MILLYCESETGQVALPVSHVESTSIGPRTYDIVEHFLEIDGQGSETVAAHDAEHICQMIGYRLASASEQNEHRKARRKSSQLTEKRHSQDRQEQEEEEKEGQQDAES